MLMMRPHHARTPGISDHDRHAREIQSVGCGLTFAQDHTFEPTKNHKDKKRMGAFAVWDAATETGEIASAVLVPSARTEHFAHAASSLARRSNFNPSATHSDTWPNKDAFWGLLFKGIEGRLGLFHYMQRVTKTLKKRHADHYLALVRLRRCLYEYHPEDYNNLLKALKEGTLSDKYTDDEIADLQVTPLFKRRYDQCLRKIIRPSHVICSMLDDWFADFKCTASDDSSRPARGRKDPFTGETSFASETKEAIKNCKEKAMCLQDPLPLDDMCDVTQPSPNSPHQLKVCLSRRGESCLESFHDNLSHFANCGMRKSLADNLHLTGTARCNLSIRHTRRLTTLTLQNPQRKKMPAAFESTASFFNHSELNHVSQMAMDAGISQEHLPFNVVEILPPDNGERFFSECLIWCDTTKPKNDLQGQCLCQLCATPTTEMASSVTEPPPQLKNNNTNTMATAEPNSEAQSAAQTQEVHQPTQPTNAQPQMQVARQQVHHRMQPAPQQQFYNHQPQPLTTQQTQQHQTHQQHPNVMMMGHCQQMTAQMPWMMPIVPCPMLPQTAPSLFCCGRYRHWHNTPNRRGRPPHDDHCQRLRAQQKKTDMVIPMGM